MCRRRSPVTKPPQMGGAIQLSQPLNGFSPAGFPSPCRGFETIRRAGFEIVIFGRISCSMLRHENMVITWGLARIAFEQVCLQRGFCRLTASCAASLSTGSHLSGLYSMPCALEPRVGCGSPEAFRPEPNRWT